jgi:long-subunit acyl-CoA synthetase (AMP-forming)
VSPSEQVKRFIVLPRPFSVEAEELTVSLKLRRNIVFGKYQDRLNSLYSPPLSPDGRKDGVRATHE